MRTATLVATQLAICAAACYWIYLFALWNRDLTWFLACSVPLRLGGAWTLTTYRLLARVGRHPALIVISVLEIPFAFAWPLWIGVMILFGGNL